VGEAAGIKERDIIGGTIGEAVGDAYGDIDGKAVSESL
jgi:hypothetical protein